MAVYKLKITKDCYELNLRTSDREMMADELGRWIDSASEYAKVLRAKECKELVNSQIREEEERTRKNIEEQISRYPANDFPSAEEIKKQTYSESELAEVSNIPKMEIPQRTISSEKADTTDGVFDKILEKSLNNPYSEMDVKVAPSIKKDKAFINYITSRRIERKTDYLLLTAYYLTQYEQKPRFTLKQLNAKLMQNIAVIIDHSVLQEAINRDYIECLPDLTGLVGANEYRLTSYGEKVLLDA